MKIKLYSDLSKIIDFDSRGLEEGEIEIDQETLARWNLWSENFYVLQAEMKQALNQSKP